MSKNEGKSYTNYLVPFSVSKIEFHPDRSDWMLGYDRGTSKVSFVFVTILISHQEGEGELSRSTNLKMNTVNQALFYLKSNRSLFYLYYLFYLYFILLRYTLLLL